MADVTSKDKKQAEVHYSDIHLTQDDIAALRAGAGIPDWPLEASGLCFKIEDNSPFSEEEQRKSWYGLLTQYASECRSSQTEEALYLRELTGKAVSNSGACNKSMDHLLGAICRPTYDSFTSTYNDFEYVLTTAQKDQLMYQASMRAKTEICELLIRRGVKFIPENFFPIAFRPYRSESLWQQADDDKVKLTRLSDTMKGARINLYL